MDELEEIRRRRMMELKKELSKKQEPVEKVVEVTDDSLKDFIAQNPLVVVDCWAPWCGPCHMIAPIVEELAKTYAGKIVFGKLNVDENPMTAQQYRIMSIPMLLVFKNGRLVDQIVGAMPRQVLEPKIERYLE